LVLSTRRLHHSVERHELRNDERSHTTSVTAQLVVDGSTKGAVGGIVASLIYTSNEGTEDRQPRQRHSQYEERLVPRAEASEVSPISSRWQPPSGNAARAARRRRGLGRQRRGPRPR